MPATTKAQAQAIAPASNGPLQATVGNVSQASTAATQPPNPSTMQDATRAATAAVAAAMAKLPPQTVQRKAQQADPTVENLTRKVNEMRTNDATRKPRGGRGGYHDGRAFKQQPTRKVEVPTTDYDFEGANAKFNKQDLVKEAIASGSPINETPDGGNPSPSIDSINEAAVEANAATTTSYNKASSFFDNISSESKDREQNTSVRPGGREWRGEEEKKNMETFGQGSVDGGFRGGYRGRGRGRGFQRGRGGFRGPSRGPGPRGGFRGGRGDATVGAD
jgi:protein LSM14